MIQELKETQLTVKTKPVELIINPENIPCRRYLPSTIIRDQLHKLSESDIRTLINTHLLNLSDQGIEPAMHPNLDPELSLAFRGCLLIGSGAREIATDRNYSTHNGRKTEQITGLRRRLYDQSEPETDLEFLVPTNQLANLQPWLEANAHTIVRGNAGSTYYHFEQRSWPYHISANIIPGVTTIEEGIKYMITTAPTPAHATCFIVNPEELLEVLPFGPKSEINGYFTMPGSMFSYEGEKIYQSMWNPNSVLFFEKNETPASLIKRFTIGIFQEPGLYTWFVTWYDNDTWDPFKALLMQGREFTPQEARSICDCFIKNFHNFNGDAISIFRGQDEVFGTLLEDAGIIDEILNASELAHNDFAHNVAKFLKEKATDRKPHRNRTRKLLDLVTS